LQRADSATEKRAVLVEGAPMINGALVFMAICIYEFNNPKGWSWGRFAAYFTIGFLAGALF
jgi:hypothetical protein